jgi:phage shock protein A
MSRFKQWSTVFLSRVDSVVSRLENHEALVDSAIDEVRHSLAKAKVQLGRVRHDRETLQRRHHQALAAVHSWTERATSIAAEDEQRALECLRRKHGSAREAAGLESRLAEQVQVEERLVADIAAVEERLTRLLHQRNLLRTRESTAAAKGAMASATSPFGEDVGEVLERWEMQVVEAELGNSYIGPDTSSGAAVADSFGDSFAAEEEQRALREELRELTQGEK